MMSLFCCFFLFQIKYCSETLIQIDFKILSYPKLEYYKKSDIITVKS